MRSPDAVTVCGDGCDVTGGYLWNEALVLTAWLLHQPPETFAGVHVLELGAGPALPDLALALHARQQLASTTLSDYEAEASLQDMAAVSAARGAARPRRGARAAARAARPRPRAEEASSVRGTRDIVPA